MKKLLFSALFAFLAMSMFSCEKENGLAPTPDSGANQDFYYVKYQISGRSYFYIDCINYNTENGRRSENFAAARSFEVICGPVNTKFTASISLLEYRGAPASNAVKISISKNNGPFAVKASGQYSASYTIDF